MCLFYKYPLDPEALERALGEEGFPFAAHAGRTRTAVLGDSCGQHGKKGAKCVCRGRDRPQKGGEQAAQIQPQVGYGWQTREREEGKWGGDPKAQCGEIGFPPLGLELLAGGHQLGLKSREGLGGGDILPKKGERAEHRRPYHGAPMGLSLLPISRGGEANQERRGSGGLGRIAVGLKQRLLR